MNGYQKFIQKIKKRNNWFYFGLPIFLSVVFFILLIFYTSIRYQLNRDAIASAPVVFSSPVQYPFLQTQPVVNISAKAALVMDDASKVILYQKNPNLLFSPASTTKIMTSLIGLETFKQDEVLTVQGPLDPEGSGIGLVFGEKMTFGNLLYAMLLPSANDAAQTVAQNYPGGEDAFVKRMNEKAQLLRLYNTHFGDPAGLQDDETYTTVVDLARLASIAMKNPIFAKVVATKHQIVSSADKTRIVPVTSRNVLLGFYGIDGIKTGYTEGAKEVLVTSAVTNGHRFILVVMSSDDRFADTVTLLHTIVEHVAYQSIDP